MLFLGNESSAVLHWALMLLATQLWRKVTSGQRREYLVDNRFLKAKTTGLSYFFSRRFDDVDPGKTAVWGQVVVGRKRGNWVKVGHCCYLPTELDGIQVLRDDFGPEDIAQTPLSPRALGRPADIPSYAPGYALEHRSEERRSPEDLEGSPTLTVDLAKDLKKALQKSVEQRQQLDDAIERYEQDLAEKRQIMKGAIEDTQLELAAAQERATLEAGLLSSSTAILTDRTAPQELASTTAARDAARHRAKWLKDELQTVQAQSRRPQPVEHGPLQTLQREVQRLRKELDTLESQEDRARHLDPRHHEEMDEARKDIAESAAEMASRSERLKRSEAALEKRRVEVRVAAEEASLQKLEANSQKAECERISNEIVDLQGEQQTASARSQQLEREAKSLALAYDRCKEMCFVYGAAILRNAASAQLGKERKASSRRGVEALIEALALRFGWPEVAFLRLDRRGSGRLGAQELRMGLLLGAGLDFPAVTGLTAEALLAAIDRRCAGFITAADLAACRPDIWKDSGAAAVTVHEKIRALPWLAFGGPAKAFQDTGTRSLKWTDFEALVCHRLRGLSKKEAQVLFAEIGEKDLSDSLVVSPTAWAMLTKEPTFDG